MKWFVLLMIATLVNTLIIITIVDIILMGRFKLKLSRKSSSYQFLVHKDNRIDMQNGNECAGYSVAYLLRHYGICASGEDVYERIGNKMNDGCVYPKEVKKILGEYGFRVKYCAGNLNALKKEVCKGNPIIVFIKARKDKKWLHYVPVVGYDEENILLAESLAELVNCNEKVYNRKISNKEFLTLWNTSMLKMPLYTHTFFVVEKM